MTAPDRRSSDDGPLDLMREWLDRTDDEVWEPEGVAFKVGDRVRIRLSGECHEHIENEDPETLVQLEGRAGTVAELDGHVIVGHSIKVVIDTVYPGRTRIGGARLVGGSWCTAAELIPLPLPDTSGPTRDDRTGQD